MTQEEKQILEQKVKASLDKIRPYLQQDGGDLRYVSLSDDKIVYVELQGHCGSCPHALYTLKMGIEEALKEEIPEIKAVERV